MIFLFLFLLGFVDGGGHLDRPWFRWRDGVIPFTFQQIDALDREVVKDTMALIEQRTCLRFQERSFAPSGHRLVVQGAKKSCLRAADGVPTFSAVVIGGSGDLKEVVLQIKNRLADSPQCVEKIRGGLLHELFHVMGVQHTQERPDRDRHVEVLKENIKDMYEYSYAVCQDCQDYGVPYDCSSIMHYGTETFSIGGQDYPTMKRKHSDCDLRWVGAAFDQRHGSEVASPSDWELLRRVAARLCKTTTNPTYNATTTTVNPNNKPTIKDNQRKPASKTTLPVTTTPKPTTTTSTKPTTQPKNTSKVVKKPVKSIWRPLTTGRRKNFQTTLRTTTTTTTTTTTRTTTTRTPRTNTYRTQATKTRDFFGKTTGVMKKPVKSIMRPLTRGVKTPGRPKVIRRPVQSIMRPISRPK